MPALRKTWVVIYGENAPSGEIENANKIADFLRKKLNVVRVLPSNAQALDLLARFCNFVVIGGPYANEWAFNLNEQVNPKYQIVVNREKTAEESWSEYATSGGFDVTGFLKNGTAYPGRAGLGLLGIGSQTYPRARLLNVVFVGGWGYGDTCTMGKAFRDGAESGMYECSYPPLTTEDPYPEDEVMNYSLLV